jgi:hypothetical protein
MTKTASSKRVESTNNSLAMKDASVFSPLHSDETWRSDTSIILDSACKTHEELTTTEEELSNCVHDEDSGRIGLVGEALEETLAEILASDCETRNSLSGLIVPYPNGLRCRKFRPAPWDSSSSEDSRNCCTPNMTQTKESISYQNSGNKFSTMRNSCDESNPIQRESLDCLPSQPKRRGSDEYLNDSSLRQVLEFVAQDDDAKKSRDFPPVSSDHFSASNLEAYLISTLPCDILSKLSKREWRQICIVAAQFRGNKMIVKESEDDGVSVVSELSDFTGLAVSLNKENPDENNTDDTFLRMRHMSKSRIHDTMESGRSWHESTYGSTTAPQIPSRRGRFSLERSNRESRSPQNSVRTITRTTSLPSDIVSLCRRSVSFDTVEVRHYEQVLDLHPSTSSGPSVGIGWNYTVDRPLKVLDVERLKDESGRRSVNQLVIPRHEREEILRDCGYTIKQIAKAVRLNLKARNQRLQTFHNYKIDQIVEKSSLQIRRLFRPNLQCDQLVTLS